MKCDRFRDTEVGENLGKSIHQRVRGRADEKTDLAVCRVSAW